MNFICVDAAVDSLFKLEIILVNGILSFHVLVVHGQPTDMICTISVHPTDVGQTYIG